MLPIVIALAMLLVLPMNVFAHVGHVEWSQLPLAGLNEWIEASVVLAALIVYRVAGYRRALKSFLARPKRTKKLDK